MSDHKDHRTPEEIEKDIQHSRERLDSTLGELEERFSPQRLLNASYDYLRHGGANEFFTNLGTTIKENPVPFLVTGAGLGWLLTAQRSGAQRDDRHYANSEAYPHSGPQGRFDSRMNPPPMSQPFSNRGDRPTGEYADALTGGARPAGLEGGAPFDHPERSAFSHPPAFDDSDRPDTGFDQGAGMNSGMKERVVGGARHMGHSASDAVHHISERAHHMGGNMRDTTSGLYRSTQHGMHDAGQWARDAGRHSSDFIQEHPLVAGALGFAIGAALGGLLPSTRREDAYMGEYRDRLMGEAAEMGHQQADKMQHSLHERTEKMKNETDKDQQQKDQHEKDSHQNEHQEHDTRHTPSDTDSEHMRYSDEAMPGHNAASGQSGNPGKQPTPHDKDESKKEHGLADSDTPSGNTQGDDTLEPPKR
ncbi:DUF3618 domain-containing protein [Halomonas sp. GD1P12]|uniref:DUF3618 domain-containing protein n=1 Tax=Halomonas sp. GD1P12 TaxID=2982691 RepID=UPI0021E4CE49|nr:DUF3618 domain-containing protein [Halomonas sp. GD1P12]UYG00620.1 DUF3618 domain-containing protein [Halomonas sp. GD1P12]